VSEERLNEVSCAQFSRSIGARRADERNWKIHGDAIHCRGEKPSSSLLLNLSLITRVDFRDRVIRFIQHVQRIVQ